MHTCFWNEQPQVSKRVVFAKCEWKYHNSLNKKTGEFDLKTLLFNNWYDLVLGSVEIYFLEVGAYMSPKWATTGIREGRFCWIWVKIPQLLKYKNGEVGPKTFLFNYWYDLVLGSIETYFLEVCGYLSLKWVFAAVWEGRFYWIWVKITQLFKYKNGGVGPKTIFV